VSRARQSSTGRLRLAPAVVGIALALAGCGAGQISSTAGMEPAVNGGIGQAGDIAIRDIQLAYPDHGVYEPGQTAVVLGSVVNSGRTEDELLNVTSNAGEVTVEGDRKLPPGRALMAEMANGELSTTTSSSTSTSTSALGTTSSAPPSGTTGSTTSSNTPSQTPTTTTTSVKPTSIGKLTLVLRLGEELRSGQTIQITFTFRSGSATVTVPIAVPTTPRGPAKAGGH
jgi:hypothetical protein